MGKELSPTELQAQRQARLDRLHQTTSDLKKKFFASYDQHIEAINEHFISSDRLQLAEQIITADQMETLVTWMDHNAYVGGATVYLMELLADQDKPHPIQNDYRVFIALGVFDRKVNPTLPYWCHVRNHYPVNLGVDLIVTDMQGNPITHAILTAFKSFDRARTYSRDVSSSRDHQPHHEIHTGVIDQKGRVIFEEYKFINQAARYAIHRLAQRQIVQKDTEVAAVWLLAGLVTGRNWRVEDYVDIMMAIENYDPKGASHVGSRV